MKKLIWFTGLLFTAALIQSCGGSGGGGNNAQPAPTCPAGSWYNYGYCYNPNNPNGTPSQYGFAASFYSGKSGNTNYWNANTNTLQIINGTKMQEFLKYAMGVCNRSQSIGLSNCESYMAGDFSVTIQLPAAPGQDAIVNFYAQPKYNPYFNYYGNLPKGSDWANVAVGMLTGIWVPPTNYYYGAERNPLQLSMKVSAINNSQGFKLHGYGDMYTGANVKLVSIEVPQGKKEDYQFNYYLQFQGVNFAQGVMQKLPY